MLFFKNINRSRFAGILTAVFIVAWFLCSVHITFSPEIAQASNIPDSHQSSSSHDEGTTTVCLDHAPTQNVSRYQNDISNTPALISNTTDEVLAHIQNVSSLTGGIIRDSDHLSMRYSFLVHNKFLI